MAGGTCRLCGTALTGAAGERRGCCSSVHSAILYRYYDGTFSDYEGYVGKCNACGSPFVADAPYRIFCPECVASGRARGKFYVSCSVCGERFSPDGRSGFKTVCSEECDTIRKYMFTDRFWKEFGTLPGHERSVEFCARRRARIDALAENRVSCALCRCDISDVSPVHGCCSKRHANAMADIRNGNLFRYLDPESRCNVCRDVFVPEFENQLFCRKCSESGASFGRFYQTCRICGDRYEGKITTLTCSDECSWLANAKSSRHLAEFVGKYGENAGHDAAAEFFSDYRRGLEEKRSAPRPALSKRRQSQSELYRKGVHVCKLCGCGFTHTAKIKIGCYCSKRHVAIAKDIRAGNVAKYVDPDGLCNCCRKPFSPTREDQLFCDECVRTGAPVGKFFAPCAVCGDRFAQSGTAKVCSRECRKVVNMGAENEYWDAFGKGGHGSVVRFLMDRAAARVAAKRKPEPADGVRYHDASRRFMKDIVVPKESTVDPTKCRLCGVGIDAENGYGGFCSYNHEQIWRMIRRGGGLERYSDPDGLCNICRNPFVKRFHEQLFCDDCVAAGLARSRYDAVCKVCGRRFASYTPNGLCSPDCARISYYGLTAEYEAASAKAGRRIGTWTFLRSLDRGKRGGAYYRHRCPFCASPVDRYGDTFCCKFHETVFKSVSSGGGDPFEWVKPRVCNFCGKPFVRMFANQPFCLDCVRRGTAFGAFYRKCAICGDPFNAVGSGVPKYCSEEGCRTILAMRKVDELHARYGISPGRDVVDRFATELDVALEAARLERARRAEEREASAAQRAELDGIVFRLGLLPAFARASYLASLAPGTRELVAKAMTKNSMSQVSVRSFNSAGDDDFHDVVGRVEDAYREDAEANFMIPDEDNGEYE